MAITAAAPATATAMYSRTHAAGALLALALAGCGASVAAHAPAPPGRGSFAWLSKGRARASWSAAGVVAGAALPRPPGWQPVHGDRGSVSLIQLRAGAIVGYLNATPRSAAETLADWTRFRVAHNTEEGDRNDQLLAAITAIRVGKARASCVIDDYRTSLSRYREIACLIVRPRTSAVVLGAAPPTAWARQQPTIERAIAAFVAG